MNCIQISGFLASEPELKKYEIGGKKLSVATFSIGVRRIYVKKGEQNADFFKVACFNKQAEFVAKYLQKGRKVIVTGSLKQDRFKDDDGKNKYVVQINAQTVEFCDTKHEENDIADPAAYVSSFMDVSGLEGADFQSESVQ